MIVAAAVVPSAPLLVTRVSANLPDGVAEVAHAVRHVLGGLPQHDLVVLLAAGDGHQGVHRQADASLDGIGRADVKLVAPVDTAAVDAVSDALGAPPVSDRPLPLDLAVLAHLVAAHGSGRPVAVAPVALPAGADPDALAATGDRIASVLDAAPVRVALVAAGDLSAGLSTRAPLYLVTGAPEWDQRAVAAVRAGRLDDLATLGPDEARRVGARGWASLVALQGAAVCLALPLAVHTYAAPRGVGYLVASSAGRHPASPA